MDKQTLEQLFEDHYRANRRLWRAVMALGDTQFTETYADEGPPVRTQLVRMVAQENLWVNYLWHGEVEFLRESQMPTRTSIRAEWDALEEELQDYLSELSPAELDRSVTPPFLQGGVSMLTWEVLVHVINNAAISRARLRLYLQRMEAPATPGDSPGKGLGLMAGVALDARCSLAWTSS